MKGGPVKLSNLPPSDDDMWTQALSDTTDEEVRIRLLSYRVSVLTREKEALETRMARLELAYTMGKGIFWAAPFLAGVISFVIYNWGWISRPWSSRP